LEHECDLVVACGGDGTNNEVLNGIMSVYTEKQTPEPCAMAVLPIGTGNDFARSAGLYDPKKSIAELHETNIKVLASQGTVMRLDLGSVLCAPKEFQPEKIDPDTIYENATASRWFLNECGAGFSASIIDTVNNSKMIFSKHFTFSFYSLWQQFTYENKLTSFEMIQEDGQTHRDAEILQLFSVGNGRFFGAGMRVNPKARMNDGLFDICTIGDGGIIDALSVVPGLYKGTHVKHGKIRTYKCSEFRAFNPRKDDHTVIQADGEIVGKLPGIWKMHKGILPFVVSKECEDLVNVV
jgi:diacylglycerol kinase family enzyme